MSNNPRIAIYTLWYLLVAVATIHNTAVREWITMDKSGQGYQYLDDDEIVRAITNANTVNCDAIKMMTVSGYSITS